MRRGKFFVLTLLCMFALAACGPKGVTPTSPQDTPEHHYLQGMTAIEAHDLAEAEGRFTRALALRPDYPPALAGMGLVQAASSVGVEDKDARNVLWGKAEDSLRRAARKADGDSERFSVHVTTLQANMAAKPEGWLDAARKAYGRARLNTKANSDSLPYYRSLDAAEYFMGRAYFEARDFVAARGTLDAVLAAQPGKWREPANALYARVQKIERAEKQHTLGGTAKDMAIKDSVTRADVAALLVGEIKLDRLLAGSLGEAAADSNPLLPADIVEHPFRKEIMTLRKWNVRGLEPLWNDASQAYLFNPDAPVMRKELALIMEDILIKMSGDESLATKFFGQSSSPFPDVAPTDAIYNAVMNAVSRDLMETTLSGAFGPDEPLNGADLLIAVTRLRDAMTTY